MDFNARSKKNNSKPKIRTWTRCFLLALCAAFQDSLSLCTTQFVAVVFTFSLPPQKNKAMKEQKAPAPVEMIWPTRHIKYQHPCVYLRDTHSSLDANNNKKYWLTSSSFSSSSPMSLSLSSNSSLLNILWSSWPLKVSPKLPSSRSTWWTDDGSFSVFPRWCCTCLSWPLGPRRRLRATAFSVRRSADCLLERLPPAFFTW